MFELVAVTANLTFIALAACGAALGCAVLQLFLRRRLLLCFGLHLLGGMGTCTVVWPIGRRQNNYRIGMITPCVWYRNNTWTTHAFLATPWLIVSACPINTRLLAESVPRLSRLTHHDTASNSANLRTLQTIDMFDCSNVDVSCDTSTTRQTVELC